MDQIPLANLEKAAFHQQIWSGLDSASIHRMGSTQPVYEVLSGLYQQNGRGLDSTSLPRVVSIRWYTWRGGWIPPAYLKWAEICQNI
jgi:hypothetical protein